MLKVLSELPVRGRVSWGAIPVNYNDYTLVSQDMLPDLTVVGNIANSLTRATPIGMTIGGLMYGTPAGTGSTRTEQLDALNYGKRRLAEQLTTGEYVPNLSNARDYIRSLADDGAPATEAPATEAGSQAGTVASNAPQQETDELKKQREELEKKAAEEKKALEAAKNLKDAYEQALEARKKLSWLKRARTPKPKFEDFAGRAPAETTVQETAKPLSTTRRIFLPFYGYTQPFTSWHNVGLGILGVNRDLIYGDIIGNAASAISDWDNYKFGTLEGNVVKGLVKGTAGLHSKLVDMTSGNSSANSPEYQALKAELDSLKNSGGFNNTQNSDTIGATPIGQNVNQRDTTNINTLDDNLE